MCGRFTHKYTWREVYEFHEGISHRFPDEDPAPNYNAPPMAHVPVLCFDESGPYGTMMRWSLVPGWSKTPDTKYSTFNARSEDAATKPTFRSAFKRRRCIIPASGFYEWKKLKDGSKQPYYITRADDDLLYFAGLWECWQDELITCTILTTTPNAEMTALHHRMPCILEREQAEAWCDPELNDVERIQEFLKPAADGLLTMHVVEKRIGNVQNNDARLIEMCHPAITRSTDQD